jgi:hypothetical protein
VLPRVFKAHREYLKNHEVKIIEGKPCCLGALHASSQLNLVLYRFYAQESTTFILTIRNALRL